jgi:CMD domain protein
MSTPTPDIIDRLAGIGPGSHLDEIRAWRPEARENAQKSYRALFEPEIPGDVPTVERYAVATFVAGLHRQPAVTAFYASGLREHAPRDLVKAIEAEIARGAAEGPYGKFPKGPLSREDKEGPVFRVSDEHRAVLGARLLAAFEHAHLLVFRPRDASPEALQKLLDAAWSTDDIVTLSQLVSFLAFQIRVIAGLRALGKNVERRVADEADESSLTAAIASGGNL